MKLGVLAAALFAMLLVAIAFGTPGDRRGTARRSHPSTRVQRAESPDDLFTGAGAAGGTRKAAGPARARGAAPPPVMPESGAARPPSAAFTAPPAAIGPAARPAPSPEDLAEAREIGARLLDRVSKGSIRLVRQDREPLQLQQLAEQGCCIGPDQQPVALSPALLHTVDWLSEHSSPERPLVLLSLYRPLSEGRPREPHGNGLAVDIAAYGGHRIDSREVEECVAGVLAVIKALGPGRYRLGLPKPPDTDPAALLPPPPRPADWPFLPAPLPELIEPLGIVAPRVVDGRATLTSRGEVRPLVSRWENERYAPLADVGSPRVRAAIEQAIARGAAIHSLFPDALDHLHLDVKPEP